MAAMHPWMSASGHTKADEATLHPDHWESRRSRYPFLAYRKGTGTAALDTFMGGCLVMYGRAVPSHSDGVCRTGSSGSAPSVIKGQPWSPAFVEVRVTAAHSLTKRR